MDEVEVPITELVAAADRGDEDAWAQIVDRYSPLLVSVIRRYRLSLAQTEDVAQTVWLRLVEHLGRLREPQALPQWLIRTARNECLRTITVEARAVPNDPLADGWLAAAVHDGNPDLALLTAERHEALLAGLAELPRHQRELLILLVQDPRPSYAQVSDRLGIAVGSIGPTRGRALEALRATAPIRSYLAAELTAGRDGERRDRANLA